MSEHTPLLEQLIRDVDSGHTVGLCSVVRTKGSTPQSPGASMLVRADMSTTGTLGGGCVEADVCKRAFVHLQRGETALMEFILNHDYGWDDGLICGGSMAIAMQPVHAGNVAPYRAALDKARRREPANFPIAVIEDDREIQYRVRLEAPPTLVIAGAGHVGQAVANLATQLDFHVVVIDDRADFASRERFDSSVELIVDDIAAALKRVAMGEHTYVVIVTRGHRHDHESLAAVIDRTVGYIGLIGSKRKARMILDDLAKSGVSRDTLERVRTPIGLSIGAITVPEIAVSIAAQLIEVRRREKPALVEGPLPLVAPAQSPTQP